MIHQVPPYFINGQHRITVDVVGLGGTGSLVLTKLARLSKALNHLEHPGIYARAIDFDLVEEHNVGRQMFTPADVGENKAVCLISKINMSFGMDWNAFSGKYQDYHRTSNIVISCVDNIPTREYILEKFYQKGSFSDTTKKYYLIDCGNARDYGQVILSDHDQKLDNINKFVPAWRSQDTVEQQGMGCSYQQSLEEQDLFINDWVSLMAVDLIKELLLKKHLNHQGFFFNQSDCIIQKIKIM